MGNSPDPLELISQYGADGVRMGMLFSTPAGNNLTFDSSICEQGKKFCNKIWNAFRFLTLNMEESIDYSPNKNIERIFSNEPIPETESNQYYEVFEDPVDRWIIAKTITTVNVINDTFKDYRINDALKSIYSLIWDDFCDWYIELIKPDEAGKFIPKEKLETALSLFEQLMKLLHPFMPFISEEIWQYVRERNEDDALIISSWPNPENQNPLISFDDSEKFSLLQRIISSLRNIRVKASISEKIQIKVAIKATDEDWGYLYQNRKIIQKLQSIKSIDISLDAEKPPKSFSDIIDGNEIYVPLAGLIDVEKEIERIQKEINRVEDFLKGVNGKLNNRNFVDNAPQAIVQNEKKQKTRRRNEFSQTQRTP